MYSQEIIEKYGGQISQEQTPFKRFLSYPIAKNKEAYFGFLRFSLGTEYLKQLTHDLKLESSLIRFLIVTVSPKQLKEEQRPVYRPAPEGVRKLYRPKKEKPQEIKPEEFEKKLEEILGE